MTATLNPERTYDMRKTLEFTALALAGIFLAETVPAAELSITFADVNDKGGQIMAQVFDSEEAFGGGERAVAQFVLPAAPGNVTLATDALADGTYAVRVMHDENDNGKLDTNLVGMPREPWGTSNDARGNFGPPKWDDASFVVEGDTAITITLK